MSRHSAPHSPVSFQVVMHLLWCASEPVSLEELEDAADSALEVLTGDESGRVLGPVVGTNHDESLIAIEFTSQACKPADVHETMTRVLELLASAGFELEYRDSSASRIFDDADAHDDERELLPA